MSRISECPGCKKTTENGEIGHLTEGKGTRLLYQCRGCGTVWEEKTVRTIVKEGDPILKKVVG